MIRSLACRVAASGLVLSIALTVSCGTTSKPSAILLLTLDTTRADHLGCYGYTQGETPRLDEFAGEATLFRHAISTVPVTLPAHSSMFTGMYPPKHGVRYNGMFRLPESSLTVAEILADNGYRTAGAPASFPLNADTGIAQGFADYFDLFRDQSDDGPKNLTLERNAAETTDVGVEFLKQHGREPFFLWLHYWDPHSPYRPPFPFDARFRDRPYDGEIAYMDREIGRLFDELRARGLWERTLVVVVGDHGEGLYEHGEKMHANLVYESTMRVPLLVKPPGARRGAVVDLPVSTVDLAPTIVEFAGIAPGPMEGRSLVPVIEGRAPDSRDLYFESHAGSLTYGWSPLEGVRRGAWKYTRSTDPELYDLDQDPQELANLAGNFPELVADFDAVLDGWEEKWRAEGDRTEVASTPLDAASARMLASLGYLGGFATDVRKGGPHPRDRIHVENDLFAARDFLGAGSPGECLRRIDGVLASDPENRFALNLAAQAAVADGDTERALRYLDRLLEHYPEFAPARLLEGEIHVHRGDLRNAVASFRAGLEAQPGDEGFLYRLAVAVYALGFPGDSREIVDRALAAGASSPSFLVLRAACQAKLGDPDDATATLAAAVMKGYHDVDTLETEPLLGPLREIPAVRDMIAKMRADAN